MQEPKPRVVLTGAVSREYRFSHLLPLLDLTPDLRLHWNGRSDQEPSICRPATTDLKRRPISRITR